MDDNRKRKQDAFIRICMDSGFRLEYTNAAIIAAKVLGCHPLEISNALGFDNMRRIADGSHPVLKKMKIVEKNY